MERICVTYPRSTGSGSISRLSTLRQIPTGPPAVQRRASRRGRTCRQAGSAAREGRMKFLVDECLSPELTKVAQARGFGDATRQLRWPPSDN